MFYKLPFFVLCLTLVSRNTYSAYSIVDAVADAKRHNSELMMLEKNFEIQKLDRYRAASGFWPVVSAQVSDNNVRVRELDKDGNPNPNETSMNYKNNGVQVQQELFAGGRTLAQMKVANSVVGAAESEYNSKVANVLLKTVDAYHEVILTRKIYDISMNNEKAMRNRLDQIQTRFKAGELTRTDVSWAKYSLCLLYTSPSPRDKRQSRMPSSA